MNSIKSIKKEYSKRTKTNRNRNSTQGNRKGLKTEKT